MRDSKMEIKTYKVLSAAHLSFKEEYTFPDLHTKHGVPLRFDFAVFKPDGRLDFLIECQGRQHYEAVSIFGGEKGLSKQKYNDNRKRQYCLKHHIMLVSIPYWDEDKISLTYIFRAAGYDI